MVALGTIAGVLVLMFLYMCVIRPFLLKKSIGLDLCYRKRHGVSNESSLVTREVIPQNNRRGVSRI